MKKKAFSTADAPPPAASYSQAVRKGDMLAVAGQVGIDPATGELAGPDIATQARRTLRNLQAVLAAASASFDDVIMVRVYLTSAEYFAAFNEVYAEFVTDPPPSRTTVFVGLGPGMLIEIDALAVLGD